VYLQHGGWQLSLYTNPTGLLASFTDEILPQSYLSVPNAERSRQLRVLIFDAILYMPKYQAPVSL
jgi:hypothetical protein